MTKKTMDIAEFRDSGLLQEVNRRFFHPIGLALSVVVPTADDSDEVKAQGVRLAGIIDARDDPEGYYFDWTRMHNPDESKDSISRTITEARSRSAAYDEEVKKRAAQRAMLFGSSIQPIDTRGLDTAKNQETSG